MNQAKNSAEIKVVILAAGEGNRLRPYTSDRPKCLVEVENCSLLDHQLDVLRSCGLKRVLVIGGYRADQLERSEFDLQINARYAETNMVWTLFSAEGHLNGDVLVSYGDIVYSREILEQLLASTADIAITIDLDWEAFWRSRSEDPLEDAESLKLSDDGSIVEVGKKPNTVEEIQGQYMGLMKFSNTGLGWLKSVFHSAQTSKDIQGKLPEKAYMTDLIQSTIDAGYRVESVPIHGGWIEVDTVSDLESEVTLQRIREIRAGIKIDTDQ